MLHRRWSALAALIAFSFSPLLAPGASASTPAAARAILATRDTAVFAGGCFWGIQAVFARIKGVVSSVSGYAGGRTVRPGYEEVSTGTTGHAESVRVIYDPSVVSYDQLLAVFFTVAHDPTELNRQGPDEGTQYRSAIFFRTPDQQRTARAFIAKLTQDRAFQRPIVTQIDTLKAFYLAENYHQNYFDLHPDQEYIVINDKPKVEHLKRSFPALYVTK